VLALTPRPATPAVERHAWCRADGINEKIGVRILAGEERTQLILDQREALRRRYLSLYWQGARPVTWRATAPTQ
jgi:hypothetical protein